MKLRSIIMEVKISQKSDFESPDLNWKIAKSQNVSFISMEEFVRNSHSSLINYVKQFSGLDELNKITGRNI